MPATPERARPIFSRAPGRRAPALSGPRACVGLLVALAFVLAPASQAGSAQPLFESDETLAITLTGPLRAITRGRKSDEQPWRAASLSYVDAGGQTIALDIELKARGNYRRKECRYPPLRLRFDKDQVDDTLFDNQRRLKLVSPCKGNDRYEDYVVEEYLVYRVFNLIGDYSFRARPLEVRFVDEKGKQRDSFGFFIEDEKRMAKRYDRDVAEWEEASFDMMNREALATYELFQFMIGGHDWSVIAGTRSNGCCHNTKLLTVDDSREDVIPVPYDFDFSGIVNTDYALPPESVPIRRVRQRYYRGHCMSPELLVKTLDRFRQQHETIRRLYSDFAALDPRGRDDAIGYIDEFYATIDDAGQLQKQVLDRCREI